MVYSGTLFQECFNADGRNEFKHTSDHRKMEKEDFM